MAPYYDGCAIPEGCGQYRVRAGVAFQPQAVAAFADDGPGIFFQIEKPFADRVNIELRVRDLSRQSESWGTELPVVQEESFTSEKITLLDIPSTNGFRVLVRVCGIAEVASTNVSVRTLRLDESARFPGNAALPVEFDRKTVTLRSGRSDVWKWVPHYAELDLTTGTETGSPRIVEITPLSPGLRIWAFATVTNNETQQVTIVTPNIGAGNSGLH